MPNRTRAVPTKTSGLMAMLALVLSVVLGQWPTAQAVQPSSPRTERVIAIMWDGLDPGYLDGRAHTPHLDRLISEGAYFPRLQAVYPTITNVAFTSLLTGAYPATTGNLAYWWNREANAGQGQSRQYAGESVVQALQRGGKQSASVGMWLLNGHGLAPDSPGALFLDPGPEFDQRMDTVIALLRGEYGYQPDFIAVYAATLDTIGHRHGPDSPRIIQALESLDGALGRLVQELDRTGLTETTTIIIATDHGMTQVANTLGGAVTRTLVSAGCVIGLCPETGSRVAVQKTLARAGYKLQWVGTNGEAVADDTEIVAVSTGLTAFMYFRGRNDGTGTEQRPFTTEEKEAVWATLKTLPQVARLFTRSQLDAMGVHPNQADFVVEPTREHPFLARNHIITGGNHGSTGEQHVPLIISGAGIKPGVVLEGGRSIDIAPTIAELLGAPHPAQAEGRVLHEAFINKKTTGL